MHGDGLVPKLWRHKTLTQTKTAKYLSLGVLPSRPCVWLYQFGNHVMQRIDETRCEEPFISNQKRLLLLFSKRKGKMRSDEKNAQNSGDTAWCQIEVFIPGM
jgi:hypothetical protein